MTPEETRFEVLRDIMKAIDDSNVYCFGTASLDTTFVMMRNLILDIPTYASKNMRWVKILKTEKPDLWLRVLPYLDIESPAMKG